MIFIVLCYSNPVIDTHIYIYIYIYITYTHTLFHGSTAPSGQNLIFEASRSHSDTSHSVGLLRTSYRLSHRPLPDNTQRSQEKTMPAAGFEPAVPVSERPQTYA